MKQLPAPNAKKAVIWNVLGSTANAFATMLLTIFATRRVGVEAGGLLGLAFGVSFIFQPFASLESRAYQSTDIDERFSYPEYLTLRLFCCIFACILSAGYLMLSGYTPEKASIIYAIILFKVLDAFSDVFQGMFQQRGYLEFGGKALFYRVALACIAYALVLFVTGDDIAAAWCLPVVSLAVIIAYDIPVSLRFQRFQLKGRFRPLSRLAVTVFPLFLSTFLNMYVLNMGKLQIDVHCAQLQGFWTPIYMPASIINLLSIFAYRPLLTPMAEQWNNQDYPKFQRLVTLIVLWDVAMTAVCMLGGAICGIWALELVYSIDLSAYGVELLIVIAGGGFNALASAFYYVLTVMRRQKILLVGDAVAFVFALVTTPYLVSAYGIRGAALAYLAAMLVRCAAFMIIMFLAYRDARCAPSSQNNY